MSFPVDFLSLADDEGRPENSPHMTEASRNTHPGWPAIAPAAEGTPEPAWAEAAPPADLLEGGGLQHPTAVGGTRVNVTPVTELRAGFKAAKRHSALVRLFRRLAVGGSIGIAVLISAAVLFNPLRRLPVNVSIGGVAVEGTKITVDSPKITGVQRDGRPFEIRARTGIQDITQPDITELQNIDSRLGAADDVNTLVRALNGVYDGLNDKMTLEGEVEIKSSTGYDIYLNSARIDFKTGALASEEPVKVLLDGGTISAKTMDVSDNGHKVAFDGKVTSMFETGSHDPKIIQGPVGAGR